MTARFGLLAILAALLAAACTAGDPPVSTRTPEVTTTPTAIPESEPTTRAPFIIPTATPPPDLVELAATVWLIDVRDNSLAASFEEFENAPYDADFDEDGHVRIRYRYDGTSDVIYTLDGTLIAESERTLACRGTDAGAEVDGRVYPETHCGPISPDGALMTYAVDAGEVEVNNNYRVPAWDQWVVELDSGSRRLLQEGLRHCGGCDFRFGPVWSATGKHLVISELLDGGLVYLADLRNDITRVISDVPRPTLLDQRPVWSPTGDRLLRPGPDGSTILEDLDAGSSAQLDDLPWPATFEASGAYIYSPAWAVSIEVGPHQQTTIGDASTGQVIAARAGTPSWERVWGQPGEPIVAIGDGFVAALGNSEDCDGTLVYDSGRRPGTCLRDAVAPTFSPDTTLVAFARPNGSFGYATYPGGASGDLPRWQIAVFDRMTGETTVVAEDAAGGQFPDLTWNEDGTHLLIRWPNSFGI